MLELYNRASVAGLEIGMLEEGNPAFEEQIDSLRRGLGAPDIPSLFPPYFLKSSFPKMGGKIIAFVDGSRTRAAAFLFPDADGGYVARFHGSVDLNVVRGYLNEFGASLYLPEDPHLFEETHRIIDGVDVGRPSESEARDIRELQRIVWGSEPDFLYPYDIHSKEFNLPTSLVARFNGDTVGFLFGFYRFGGSLPAFLKGRYGSDLRVESQLMGVLPDFRKKGIAFNLKREQALKAQEQGIDIVNWTVDPLQFGNAVLNFGKLRAVAFDFYPNYYQFRNELNQVPASRISVSWFISSDRVKRALGEEASALIHQIRDLPQVEVVNDGFSELIHEARTSVIAIEIPRDWTGLQKTDIGSARRWRETTDMIFALYLGDKGQNYALTDVAIDSSQNPVKYYLLARRLEDIPGL